MATTYARSSTRGGRAVTWGSLGSADNGDEYEPDAAEPLGGAVQVSGTFGGATVVLQKSNIGGSNWVDMTDVDGNAISFTATGMAEFSTGARYIRPKSSGGSGSSIVVTVTFRG